MQDRTQYLWQLVINHTKKPIYVVDVSGLDMHSLEYANIVGWLEANHADNWCELAGPAWATINVIGFQDAAIAMEFKLTYGA